MGKIVRDAGKAILEDLIAARTVKIENDAYIGLATDGVWVHLSHVDDKIELYEYLYDNPIPEKW